MRLVDSSPFFLFSSFRCSSLCITGGLLLQALQTENMRSLAILVVTKRRLLAKAGPLNWTKLWCFPCLFPCTRGGKSAEEYENEMETEKLSALLI